MPRLIRLRFGSSPPEDGPRWSWSPLRQKQASSPRMSQGHTEKAQQQKEWQRQDYESHKQFFQHLPRRKSAYSDEERGMISLAGFARSHLNSTRKQNSCSVNAKRPSLTLRQKTPIVAEAPQSLCQLCSLTSVCAGIRSKRPHCFAQL
jgi:hypothetical protein